MHISSFLSRWYDRARERVWKKHGAPLDHSIEIKRSVQSRGLLGYRVLIDGFNNTFDPSVVSNSSEASRSQANIEELIRYNTYSNEERENMLKTKVYMKQFLASHPRRAKTVANSFGRRSRNTPLLAQHGIMGARMQAVNYTTKNSSVLSENFTSSSEFSHSQDRSTIVDRDYQSSKLTSVSEELLSVGMTQPIATTSTSLKPKESEHY